MSTPFVRSTFDRVEAMAGEDADFVFSSIAHLIDVPLLLSSFDRLRKSSASGIDEVTVEEYREHLTANIFDLHDRLRTNRYRATPVRRTWIPKEDGKKRPIGIPVLEDKIVQRAAATVLESIYEHDFYDFSYGFRPGRSAHDALQDLRSQSNLLGINWVLDVDIQGFFDNIDHGHLLDLLHRRVHDGGMDRLIGRWLNAGVFENGSLSYPEHGTPQGGVISPMLANIYLHYVLDDWFVKEVMPRLKGRCFLIRYADDFVMGFENESDARRVLAVINRRMQRFGLNIHPDKTRLVRFRKSSRYAKKDRSNGTFDFLGFTHYLGQSLRGYWVIKRRTMSKRIKRTFKRIGKWCRYNRHLPILEQYRKLCQKLRGHYQYFGLRANYERLDYVYKEVKRLWRKWLSRRSEKGYLSWEKFQSYLARYPLPKPRIVHLSV